VSRLSLDDWLERIERLHPRGIELGLERVAAVAARLLGSSTPRPAPVTYIVGGTNGKGSACAMLEAIVVAAGYRCGCYTSPHLLRFNERIRVDGEEATDGAVVEHFEQVEAARLGVAAGPVSLTYFEFTTLAALALFGQHALDVAILEVGLGGRLDAVNVVDADCAVLMMIDIDHRDWLGQTREAIGAEKAPIMRPGRPVVVADPEPPMSVLEHAAAVGADLWRFPRDFRYETFDRQWTWYGRQRRQGGLAHPAIRGANQLLNAATVLAALETQRQRLPIPAQAIRQGLARVSLPGRFQVLPGQPTIVLDVGHNPQAAAHLARNLDEMGFYPRTWAVFGMLGDKDAAAVVRQLLRVVDRWICCDLPGPRGLSGENLAAIVRAVIDADRTGAGHDVTVAVAPTPGAALKQASSAAQATDRIVVFGSFLTVADVQRTLAAATTGNAPSS
jgi:dihydrofolate synthase/folylpolyglutamate synthase